MCDWQKEGAWDLATICGFFRLGGITRELVHNDSGTVSDMVSLNAAAQADVVGFTVPHMLMCLFACFRTRRCIRWIYSIFPFLYCISVSLNVYVNFRYGVGRATTCMYHCYVVQHINPHWGFWNCAGVCLSFSPCVVQYVSWYVGASELHQLPFHRLCTTEAHSCRLLVTRFLCRKLSSHGASFCERTRNDGQMNV